MSKPIALQLNALRNRLARDFEGTLRQVAAMGYAGVEPADLPAGVTPAAVKTLFDALGLAVCAVHAPLPLGREGVAVLDRLAALGCERLVCAWLSPDDYSTVGGARRVCERLNEAAAVCARHGLRLGVRNHWFEFQPIGGHGPRPYELWLEELDPRVFVELDAYWVQVAGVDPAEALSRLGSRVQLLHVKDGPAHDPQADMTAVGAGVVDYPAIIPAASAADWLIVGLDRCATDRLTAIEQSLRYLVDKGLGHGRVPA